MNTEQLHADFEAWLPKAYRQPQESYSVHNMEVAFAAGYQAGRAALASPEVQALRDVLERCRLALEPYDDIKPRDWKSDRENLRRAHQAVCAALVATGEKK